MAEYDILLTGGTSPLGDYLVPRLVQTGRSVVALGRTAAACDALRERGVVAVRGDLDEDQVLPAGLHARTLLHAAGMRFSVGAARLAVQIGAQQIVAVSSASASAKGHPRQQQVLAGEARMAASAADVRILRPTMIYGGVRDRNVRKLDALVQRLPIVPRLHGGGLMQPVLVDDVVSAALEALHARGLPTSSPMPVGGPEPVRLGDLLAGLARLRDKAALGPSLPLTGIAAVAGGLHGLRPSPLLHALAMLRSDRVVDPPEQAGWSYQPTPIEIGLRRAVDRYGSGARASVAQPARSAPR